MPSSLSPAATTTTHHGAGAAATEGDKQSGRHASGSGDGVTPDAIACYVMSESIRHLLAHPTEPTPHSPLYEFVSRARRHAAATGAGAGAGAAAAAQPQPQQYLTVTRTSNSNSNSNLSTRSDLGGGGGEGGGAAAAGTPQQQQGGNRSAAGVSGSTPPASPHSNGNAGKPTAGGGGEAGATHAKKGKHHHHHHHHRQQRSAEGEGLYARSPVAHSIASEESLDSLLTSVTATFSTHATVDDMGSLLLPPSTSGAGSFLSPSQPASPQSRGQHAAQAQPQTHVDPSHDGSGTTPTTAAAPAAVAATGLTEEEMTEAQAAAAAAAEQRELIYRLCRSLYKRARQQTMSGEAAGGKGGKGGKAGGGVQTPTGPHERNMTDLNDWRPLLHLFEPAKFFEVRRRAWRRRRREKHRRHRQRQQARAAAAAAGAAGVVVGGEGGEAAAAAEAAKLKLKRRRKDPLRASRSASAAASVVSSDSDESSCSGGSSVSSTTTSDDDDAGAAAALRDSFSLARSPEEASAHMLDELDVERLTGGNSNFVYRLCHPRYPGKSILLRVYGGGDSEAIDRLRDLEAMRQMSRAELSPAVLHTFRWGRVEEFMDNVATATTEMLLAAPQLLAEMFAKLRLAHTLVPVRPFLPETVNSARLRIAAAEAGGAAPSATAAAAVIAGGGVGGDPHSYLEVYQRRFVEALGAPPPPEGEGEGGCGVEDQERQATAEYYQSLAELKVFEDVCPTSFERATLRFLRLASPLVRRPYRAAYVNLVVGEVMRTRRWLRAARVPVCFSHNDLNPGNVLLSWARVPEPFRGGHAVTDMLEEAAAADAAGEAGGEAAGARTPLRRHASTLSTASTNDPASLTAQGRVKRSFPAAGGRSRNLVDHKGMVFIDFEYSDANHRCADLGNTICELDYDYTRGLPEEGGPGFVKPLAFQPPASHAERWSRLPPHHPRMAELMLEAWLRHTGGAGETDAADAADEAASLGDSCLNALAVYFGLAQSGFDEGERGGNGGVCADGIARLTREQLRESFLGMLLSHLHWAQWSLVMANNPDENTRNADDGEEESGEKKNTAAAAAAGQQEQQQQQQQPSDERDDNCNGDDDDGGFARGSSGLDYIVYGEMRLREYFALRDWLIEKRFVDAD